MTKPIWILIFYPILFNSLYGQRQDTSKVVVKNGFNYEPINDRYFIENANADIFIRYYYSDAKSQRDKFSYEIILADSLLSLEFHSPKSDSYNYISYTKKQILHKDAIDSIRKTLELSRLKQKINGFPIIDGSAHTTENLFVKFDKIKIAGGVVYSNILSFPENTPSSEIKQKIEEERRASASIEGSYDLVIDNMKKRFADLNILILEATR